MDADGVHLARRTTGGGAVFHSLGNTNFTLVSSRPDYDKEANNQIICGAMGSFGLDAAPSGRNDILIDGKKVSGQAYRLGPAAALQHGTLMLDVDIEQLPRYLTPSKAKLAAKGIASVRSRVANLKDFAPGITHDAICDAVTSRFFETHAGKVAGTCTDVPIEHISPEALAASDPRLRALYLSMESWDWRFGHSPDFSHELEHKFDWGLVTIHLDVVGGRVCRARVFSDALVPAVVDELEMSLQPDRNDPLHYSGVDLAASVLRAAEKAPEDVAAMLVDAAEFLVAAI
eukprot:gnl/Ergobibamus_cyprinoides/596.p1 GENE.gnl/Ergobibamus_cyprinoides/596~~gnl/Ergobibamus_cyprinoides/596.p1  ORF type:complete len:288 (+),score=91.22 gnl/Ergobibamus_cyprinoides/596:220-1083(+)